MEKAKQTQPEVMSDHSSAYRIFSSIRGAVYVFGICIHMQVGTHACECLEGQRFDSLDMELLAVVHLMWVLGTEPRSSEKAASPLNCHFGRPQEPEFNP